MYDHAACALGYDLIDTYDYASEQGLNWEAADFDDTVWGEEFNTGKDAYFATQYDDDDDDYNYSYNDDDDDDWDWDWDDDDDWDSGWSDWDSDW